MAIASHTGCVSSHEACLPFPHLAPIENCFCYGNFEFVLSLFFLLAASDQSPLQGAEGNATMAEGDFFDSVILDKGTDDELVFHFDIF